MIICATCIHLLTHLYFIIAINTGLEIERVCRPRENESPDSYYKRAQAFNLKIGNWEEWGRVIRLEGAMEKTETDGWIVPRTAEYVVEKVRNAKKMAMSYSCERAFDILRNACDLHREVLEPEELEKYKLLEYGWTSNADWDKKLKDREAEVKLNNWVGGVPSKIRKEEASIRKQQEEQRKEWDPVLLGN